MVAFVLVSAAFRSILEDTGHLELYSLVVLVLIFIAFSTSLVGSPKQVKMGVCFGSKWKTGKAYPRSVCFRKRWKHNKRWPETC